MRYSTLAAISVAALLVFSSAQGATRIDDPVKFVTGVYKNLTHPTNGPAAPDDIYSARLAALFALDTKEANGEVGRFEADIWTNAQDIDHFVVLGIKGQDVYGIPGRKVVIAKFKNGTSTHTNLYYFEKTGAGWKLDDVVALGTDGYTLSVVLKYGWVEHP
jgi:hypothetical protein